MSNDIEADVDQIGMEVALLVAAARSKGIDPAIWLHIEENEGMLAISEFNDRIVSLAAAVGIQENAETKRELQFATSVVSLNTITDLCGQAVGGGDEDCISSIYFLELCAEKIRRYLESVNPSGGEELEVIGQIQSERQAYHRFSSPPKAVGPEDDEEEGFNYSNPYSEQRSPPGSASGAGNTSHSHGHTKSMHIHTLKQSPYDLELSRHEDDDEGEVNFYAEESDDIEGGSVDGSVNTSSSGEYCDDECEMNTVDYEELHGKFPGHMEPGVHSSAGEVGLVPDSPTLSLKSEPDDECLEDEEQEQNTSFPKPSQIDPMAPTGLIGAGSRGTRISARTQRGNVAASVPSQRPKTAGSNTSASDATGKPSMLYSGRASLVMGEGVAVTAASLAAVATQKAPDSEQLLKQLQGSISELVHKPEVFHILRVKLGLFNNSKPYTITPARGPIIFSPAVSGKTGALSKTEWISLKDVQRVFGDSGLRMTELHQILMLKLIVVFATQCQQGQLSVSSSVMGELIANANKENNAHSNTNPNNNKKTSAAIPKVIMNRDGVQYVNTFWLSKFLTYSRITKSGSSASASLRQSQDDRCIGTGVSMSASSRRHSMASVAASTAQALRASVAQSNEEPPALIPHDQWLMQKSAQQKALKEEKVEQFKKALSGILIIPCSQPVGSSALSQKILAHAQYISSNLAYTQGFQSGKGSLISASEMDALMLKYEVIPKHLLDTEIALRKDFWLYDCDGRKDFLHCMNVALHKVQHQQPTHSNSKIPVNLNWKKLSADERNSIIRQLTEQLCEEKVNELYHLEHVEASITKTLYWKYLHYVINNYNVSSPDVAAPAIPWGKWLEEVHLAEFEKAIATSQTDMQERHRINRILKERKAQIAPLNVVEAKLLKVSAGLSSFHQLELQKKLIGMRKNATFNSPLLSPLPAFKPNTDHRPKKETRRAPPGNAKPNVPWIKCRDTGIATHGLIISKSEYESALRQILAPCTADLIANKLDEELVNSGVGYWEVKKQLDDGVIDEMEKQEALKREKATDDDKYPLKQGVTGPKGPLFSSDKAEAFSRSLKEEQALQETTEEEYNYWKKEKDEKMKATKEKKVGQYVEIIK